MEPHFKRGILGMSRHSKRDESGSGNPETHDNSRKQLWFPISTHHENDMSQMSLLADPFLTVTSVHAKGLKLSNLSLEEISRLEFVTFEIKKFVKTISNPLNDDTTIDDLGLKLVMLQKENEEIDKSLRKHRRKRQLVVDAQSTSVSVCTFYKY